MNKTILFIFVLFFLILNVFSIQISAFPGTNLLHETFEDQDAEDGSPLTWRAYSGGFRIVNEGCHGGTYCLRTNTSVANQIYMIDLWDGSASDLYIDYWINVNTTDDLYFLFKDNTGIDNVYADGYTFGQPPPDNTVAYWDGGAYADTGNNYGAGWQNIVMLYNATNQTVTHFWIDGVLKWEGEVDAINSFYGLYFYDLKYNILIDDLKLNSTNVSEGASPTLTINHNLSNTINITEQLISFGYNGTYSNTDGVFNCSLGVNGIHNQTIEVNLSNNQNFSYDFGIIEYTFSINIYCENADVNDNTTNYFYSVDTISHLAINHNLVNTINYDETSSLLLYNGTYSRTTDIFNCTLFLDNILNQTDSNVNLSINQNFTAVWGIIEHNFTVNISCSNPDISNNTGAYYYAVDTIPPVILLVSPTDLNGTSYATDSDLIVTFNFTDTNIDGYNVTWYDTDGITVLQTFYTENLTGGSYVNVSSYELTDTGTNYSIIANTWDSHNPTTKPVKPLHWYHDNNNLFAEDFTFKGDFKFYDAEDDLLTYFYLEDNKYKMKLTFNEDKLTHYINLTASGSLRYLTHTEYIGHFIYKPKMRYIDFIGKNIKNVSVLSCGIYYCLEVELYESSDEIELESIGDLNYAEQTYYYHVFSQDTVYLASIDATLTDINSTMVRRGDIMIIFPFIPLLIGLLLLVGSAVLGEEHIPMRIFLFVIAFLTPIISLQYGIQIINYYNSEFSEILSNIGVHSTILATVFFIVFVYFTLYSAVKIINSMAKNKADRLRY